MGAARKASRATQNKKKLRSRLYFPCHVTADVRGPSRNEATLRLVILLSSTLPACLQNAESV